MTTTVLEEAAEVLEGPRRDAYGDPVATCRAIGRVWGALLGVDDLTPATVALMMVGLKLGREAAGGPNRDNLVDGAGYLRIAEMCEPLYDATAAQVDRERLRAAFQRAHA